MKEFNLSYKNKSFVRRLNRNDFVDDIEIFNYEKQNRIALFFLTFNLSNSVLKLIDMLNKDSARSNFDIIIIDNHSDSEHINKIKNLIKSKNIKNIIYIYTSDNLGGAGGNAIGLEYILSKKYEYCVFTEDDAIPTTENIINELINSMGQQNIVKPKWNMTKRGSCTFHFTLYPVSLIEKIGVPDPSFFMRADDEEFSGRIQKLEELGEYKTILVNSFFDHPMFKQGAGKYWQSYFAIRNSLVAKMRAFWSIKMWGNFKNLFNYIFYQFITIFLYIWTSLLKFFVEGNNNLIIVCLLGIYDYLAGVRGYLVNKKRMSYLIKKSNEIKKFKIDYKWVKFSELCDYTNDLFLGDPALSRQSLINIKYSKNPFNVFKFGSILTSFNLPNYPLIFFSKRVISIEEFNLDKKEILVGELYGARTFINVILSILSLFLSIIIFLPISIIILLKMIIFKLYRMIGK